MAYFLAYIVIGFLNHILALGRVKRVIAIGEAHENYENAIAFRRETDKEPAFMFALSLLIWPLGWFNRFAKLVDKLGK